MPQLPKEISLLTEHQKDLIRHGRRIYKQSGLAAVAGAGLKELARSIDGSAANRATEAPWWKNVLRAYKEYGRKAAATTLIVYLGRALDRGVNLRSIRGGDRGVDYALWSERFDTLTATDRSLIVSSVARLSYRPLIS
ncbi:hypothetical protein, partial [Agrobacterium vitis]